jgi:hypothetical protein
MTGELRDSSSWPGVAGLAVADAAAGLAPAGAWFAGFAAAWPAVAGTADAVLAPVSQLAAAGSAHLLRRLKRPPSGRFSRASLSFVP